MFCLRLLPLVCLPCLFLTSCSLSRTAAPTADAGLAIQGKVMGGQSPITGANVYLFAANTTGYGGPGIAASSSNASVSLLTSLVLTNNPSNSGQDGNGNFYVTTSGVTGSCPNGGCFAITGDYSCTPNTQVYLYATGGNPGLTPSTVNNGAIGLVAALGNCPSVGNFTAGTPSIPYVVINEVTTIAAAYAFAGFATDTTHVSSSGTALAQTGIQNAFVNAANLAGISTGVALATTPAGNGTVPQSEINTLANILASCVNTTGAITGPTSPTACYTLFNDAESGGSSGTIPADTATAAINLAHNPGANIAALYALSASSPPFANALSAQPNDFTIGLNYTGGGVNLPASMAIDASGNAWMTNVGANTLSEFSSAGAPLSPSSGYSGGGLNDPNCIALDSSGNAWITNGVNPGVVSKFSSSGAPLSPSGGYTGGLYKPQSVALDSSGNAWIANYDGDVVSKFSTSSDTTVATFSGGGLGDNQGIAVDGSGNVWLPNYASSSVSKFSNAGVPLSPSSGYTGGGLDNPWAVAADGSGHVWVTNNSDSGVSKFSSSTGAVLSPSGGYTGGGLSVSPAANGGTEIAIDGSGNVWVTNVTSVSLAEFSTAGAPRSPSSGYTAGGGLNGPTHLAIDGSGDIWIANAGTNSVTEIIGTATPVVTPLVANLVSPYSAPASKP